MKLVKTAIPCLMSCLAGCTAMSNPAPSKAPSAAAAIATTENVRGPHAPGEDLLDEPAPSWTPPPIPAETDASIAAAQADQTIPNNPALTDKFFIGIGAFKATSNTQARLDSNSGLGTTVDFEDLLGLPEGKLTPEGLFRWRMSERWRLELEHFGLNRNHSTTLGQDITWGDTTIPAGTQFKTTYDTSVTRISTGYSFFKTQDKEVGAGIGFHVTKLNAELKTSGGSGDEGKVLAPLPVFSLYGQVALTDIWAIASRLDIFQLSYGQYSGQIDSFGLDLLCHPWRHVGFGLGYRTLDYEVSADTSDFSGSLETNYRGPIAFISFSF